MICVPNWIKRFMMPLNFLQRFKLSSSSLALLLITFQFFFVQRTQALQWLALTSITALATEPHFPTPTDCDHLHRSLVKQEMKFCKDHPAFMKAVRDGAKWAIDECQFQFRTRRWNCSTLNNNILQLTQGRPTIEIVPIGTEKMQRTESSPPTNLTIDSHNNDVLRKKDKTKQKLKKERFKKSRSGRANPKKYKTGRRFRSYANETRRFRRGKNGRKKKYRVDRGPVFPQGTREAAFVHAISSAGVAHAITRRCSSGVLDDCGCDRSVRGTTKNGFQWEGCSDNIAYGISLSKRFVDAKDMHLVKKSKRIKKNRKRKSRVARALMNLHNNEAGRNLIHNNMRVQCKCHGVSGSCEVKTCWKSMPSFREIGELLKEKFDGATEVKAEIIGGRAELQPNQQFFNRPSETDLVYLVKSPEYCDRDLKHGSLGTTGRRCNKKSHSLDGCDLLCCGRGHTTKLEKIQERCNCKFHWCCYVKCSICTRNEEVHICN